MCVYTFNRIYMAMQSMRIGYPTIQIRCTLTAHHLRFFAEPLHAASARLHASLAQTPLLLVFIIPTSPPPTPTTTTAAASRTTATCQIQITTTIIKKKQQPTRRMRKKRRERKTNRESDDVRTRSNGSSLARCPTAANPMAMKDPSRPT